MSRRFFACALLLALVGCGSETPTNTTSPTPVPQHGPYTLSGAVRDEAGAPLQGAEVYVGYDPRRPGFGEATTDLQGHYLVSGLFAGRQPVYVSKPGYLRISEMIEIAEGAVKDFTLRPGVIVSGRDVGGGGGPVDGGTINLSSRADAGLPSNAGRAL